MNHRLIYITVGSKMEAEKIARELLENHLIACANILPEVQSMFWWNGKLDSASEVVLIAKTHVEKVEALIEKVKQVHSYECPCVVSLPIETGYQPFLDWITEQTESKTKSKGIE